MNLFSSGFSMDKEIYVLEEGDLVRKSSSVGIQLVFLSKKNLFKSLVNWSPLENFIWIFFGEGWSYNLNWKELPMAMRSKCLAQCPIRLGFQDQLEDPTGMIIPGSFSYWETLALFLCGLT